MVLVICSLQYKVIQIQLDLNFSVGAEDYDVNWQLLVIRVLSYFHFEDLKDTDRVFEKNKGYLLL